MLHSSLIICLLPSLPPSPSFLGTPPSVAAERTPSPSSSQSVASSASHHAPAGTHCTPDGAQETVDGAQETVDGAEERFVDHKRWEADNTYVCMYIYVRTYMETVYVALCTCTNMPSPAPPVHFTPQPLQAHPPLPIP